MQIDRKNPLQPVIIRLPKYEPIKFESVKPTEQHIEQHIKTESKPTGNIFQSISPIISFAVTIIAVVMMFNIIKRIAL